MPDLYIYNLYNSKEWSGDLHICQKIIHTMNSLIS